MFDEYNVTRLEELGLEKKIMINIYMYISIIDVGIST